MEMEPKIINVLIIDDDDEDIDLTLEVMELSKLKIDIDIAHDGQEGLNLLKDRLKNNKTLPDLILLDLNMPKMNGHEFLAEVKKDDKLKIIPVVILTTSDSDSDIIKGYSKGISCYITKPVGLSEFSSVVEAINNFWFTVVKYPNK